LDVGNVLVIHEKDDHLWVAGERGLALFEGDRFRSLRTVEPNVLRGISGAVETDEGDLWLHGLDGAILLRGVEVRKAIEQPGHAMTYRLFSHEDGLLGSPTEIRPLPTLVQGSDGRLWFATKRGPYVLDPRNVVTNSRPPTVLVKAVVAGSASHLEPRSLELPPMTSKLEFDYTTTSLAAARQVRFRYRLVGIDSDWQEAGERRQAFYTNLGPGRYRFEVIAANEDGVWNTSATLVDVRIAPAWFQTPWFFSLCALATVWTLALFYRTRMRQVRERAQGRLQERLLERERIARELHDTLIQSFQGLILTFSAAMRRIPEGQLARTQMEKALLRADEALAEGRDRVHELRSPMSLHGDLVTALREAADDLQHLQPSVSVEVLVRGTPRALHPVVLEEAFRIGREALTNAFHHAQAASIGVEIAYGGTQLRLHICDHGRGIDGDILAKGGIPGHWGMSGMRERAQKLGARLLIRSGAGAGTDVELDIPAAVAYREPGAIPWWQKVLPRRRRAGNRHDD
jgi:signal transduction histidine kinase